MKKKRIPKLRASPIDIMSKMDKAEIDRIMSNYYISLDRVKNHRGEKSDLRSLIRVCRLLYIASKSGHFESSNESSVAIMGAENGVKEALNSAERGLNVKLDDNTYQTCKEVLESLEYMLSNASRRNVKAWLIEQDRSINSGVFQTLQD